MNYVCIKKCFYKKYWRVGETLHAAASEQPPKHFELIKDECIEEVQQKPVDTFTMADLSKYEQEEEAKRILKYARRVKEKGLK